MKVWLLVLLVAPILYACSEPGRTERTEDRTLSSVKPQADSVPEPCHGKAPQRMLREGKHQSRPNRPVLPRPAKGSSYRDPDYGSCIVRLTDHRKEPPNGFARNYYSRKQSFNADESLILIFASDGHWHLYDADTFRYVRQLELGGGSTEPQWHPKNPELLYILPNHGGLSMYTYNVRNGQRRQVANFDHVKGIHGRPDARSIRDLWPEARRVWTRWEGSPSIDGRYWAFQVETEDEKPLGLITFDLAEQRITGTFDIRDVGRPDHVSMSPKGRFAVASWPSDNADCPFLRKTGTLKKPCAVMSFTRDFSRGIGLAPNSPHSDMAIAANGREVIVLTNYVSGNVEMIDLENGDVTPLWRIYIDGAATALHISGKAFDKPGWALMSTYWVKDPRNASPWYTNKIFAVELKPEPRILNIANIVTRARTYFSEPHASVNRDFTRVLFNANWGTGRDEDIDTYLAMLSPDAIPPTGPQRDAERPSKN